MVIGRPNVINLLISAYRESAIHTIFKILTLRSLYNTLPRIESSVFSGSPNTELDATEKEKTTSGPSSLPTQSREIIRAFFKTILSEFIMIRRTCLILLFVALFAAVWGLPQQPKSRRPVPEFKNKTGGLELPDNATLIRENIVDTFSCKDRIYGYYADMENDCQLFHVCLPQTRGVSRWSFICPMETVFNQATFVCTRTEDSIPCEESEKFYDLNEAIGKEVEEEEQDTQRSTKVAEIEGISNKPPARTSRILTRKTLSKNQ